MVDVTDATFEQDVIERSKTVPVVVDLWAPWCGPCKTLGPIIEKVIADTGGKVELAKVNVDENPQVSRAFQVQSIPAVYALKDGKVVDGFVGAQPEAVVAKFVETLLPTEEETEVQKLLRAGDAESLRRVLDLEPDNADAIVALAELLVREGQNEDALQLLARIPETGETRRVAAMARLGDAPADDVDSQLESLLGQVKEDDEARQKFVDLLEVLGPDDPRTAQWRRRLTQQLY
ncbi:MAG TPA: thioredoxin [Acidimicrobiales bacterium]|nr:thioredoxin [Acidimicrobiales bacterium]